MDVITANGGEEKNRWQRSPGTVRVKHYYTDEKLREKMKGYTDLWIIGSREILRIA